MRDSIAHANCAFELVESNVRDQERWPVNDSRGEQVDESKVSLNREESWPRYDSTRFV
jgi:hypothetical protein